MAKENHIVTIRARVPITITKAEQVKELLKNILEVETVKFPLKSGTGMAKGSNFERELGTKLSLWWTNGEDAFVFARRGGSGGSFRDKKGKSGSSGDLTADKPIGEQFTNRYSIEAKFYNDLTPQVWNLITGEKATVLETFWKQTIESALPYNRYSLLIIRCNSKQPIVITNDDWFKNFPKILSAQLCNTPIYVLSLKSFLTINPETFKSELAQPAQSKKIIIKNRTTN